MRNSISFSNVAARIIGNCVNLFLLLYITFSSIKFKNALLEKMTTVKIGSLQQATMVVGVVALATDADNGISSDSQV